MGVKWVTLAVAAVFGVGACGAGDDGQLEADLAAVRAELEATEGELAEAVKARDHAAAKVVELEGEASTAAGELEAARSDVDAKAAEVTTLTEERDRLLDDIANAEADKAAAEGKVAAAEDAQRTAEQGLAEVLRRFDADIRAAIEAAQASADTVVCETAERAGFDQSGKPNIATVAAGIVADIPEAALGGREFSDLLDVDALRLRLEECYAIGDMRRHLEGPHGDGLYTVGVEIAAGKWRSDGEGDTCYWKLSPDGNPDQILANHFGLAGGSVTLRDGQEFETDRCGTWTKVG